MCRRCDRRIASQCYTKRVKRLRLSKKQTGFTLVELLVVITIIAILATIGYVIFTGMRDRAYNAKVIAGARQYYAAINDYYAMTDTYPETSGEQEGDTVALTCLGTGYAGGTCGTVTGVEVMEDAVFNEQMKTIISGRPPVIGGDSIPVQGESFVGAVYGRDMTAHSSTGYARTIQYALRGANQDCVLAGAWAYDTSTNPPTTACEIDLEEL